MDKLTPWFPASVKPVHDGVYEVTCPGWRPGAVLYSYWDGASFNYVASVPFAIEVAFEERFCSGAGPDVTGWRGLAKEPK